MATQAMPAGAACGVGVRRLCGTFEALKLSAWACVRACSVAVLTGKQMHACMHRPALRALCAPPGGARAYTLDTLARLCQAAHPCNWPLLLVPATHGRPTLCCRCPALPCLAQQLHRLGSLLGCTITACSRLACNVPLKGRSRRPAGRVRMHACMRLSPSPSPWVYPIHVRAQMEL